MGKCKEITVNGIIVLLFLIIFGLAVFVTGFGAHVILQIEDIQIFLEDSFYNTVISGTGIGAAVLICIVILIISFAMIIALDDSDDDEDDFLLGPVIILFLIFLLFFAASVVGQLGVGIAAFKHEGNLENGIKTKMNETMFQYNVTSKFWDFVQQNYQCCGVLEYKDWFSTPDFNFDNVPDSCCLGGKVQDCGSKKVNPENIFTDGCLDPVSRKLEGYLKIIGGTTLAYVALPLLILTVSLSFCCYTNNGE